MDGPQQDEPGDPSDSDPGGRIDVDQALVVTPPPGAPWASFLASLGLGLAVLEALYLIFVLGQGFAVRKSGAGSFAGDLLHRIGIAFSGSVNLAHGLALIVAVALVVIPLAGAGAEGRAVAVTYGRNGCSMLPRRPGPTARSSGSRHDRKSSRT